MYLQAQLWEARKGPGRASGLLYREQGEVPEQHKRAEPAGRVGATQLAPAAQCSVFMHPNPKKRKAGLPDVLEHACDLRAWEAEEGE